VILIRFKFDTLFWSRLFSILLGNRDNLQITQLTLFGRRWYCSSSCIKKIVFTNVRNSHTLLTNIGFCFDIQGYLNTFVK